MNSEQYTVQYKLILTLLFSINSATNDAERTRSLQRQSPLALPGSLRGTDAHRSLNGWFPCGTNTHCVTDRATCAVKGNGMGTCACKDGFGGEECQPLDECETESPCPGGSVCVDMFPPEMFKCTCKPGFTAFLPNEVPDGVPLEYRPVACIDDDECADTENPPCHPNATCTNTVGNFECKCNGDLVGNGITACAAPPQVETVTEAPPQADCSIDTDCQGANMQCVDHGCTCRPGYAQVGPNCQNEVHCDEDGFNNDCHRRATCTEEEGFPGFSCNCWEGWEDAFEGANGKACKDIPPVTEAPPPEPTTTEATVIVQSGVGPHPNRPTVFPPKCKADGLDCTADGACCSGKCGANVVVPVPLTP